MTLAARGLREGEDGRTLSRLEGEWLSVVQRQARKVWLGSIATAVIAGAAAVSYALLRN